MEAVVEYPYTAQEIDELTLKKGDIIKNIKTQPGGWWEGSLGSQRGMFPDNFVRVINDPSKPRGDGVTLRQGGSRRKCRVLFSYQPVNDDELQLLPDDVIDVLEEVEEGWWKGKLKERIGVFPSNFVSEIAPTESSRHSSPGHQRDVLSTSREDAASNSSTSSLTGTLGSPNETIAVIDDAPSLPPKPVKETCLALFPYEAANDDELSLKEGDIIVLLSREVADKGWWRGELRGRVGVFPDNFVEVIPLDETLKKPERPTSKPHMVTTNRARDSLTKTPTAAVITGPTTNTTTTSSNTTPVASAPPATSMVPNLDSKTQSVPPPVVSKKPSLPPPPTTKKPQRSSSSSSTSGPKRESSETAEGPGPTKAARAATDLTDGAALSLARGRSSDTTSNRSGLGEFDMVVRHGMLTQPTRERGPRRRPPKAGVTSSSLPLPVSPFGYNDGLTNGTNEDASMEEDIPDESELQQSLIKPRDPNWKPTPSPQQPQQQQAPWVEELKMNQARKSQSPKGTTSPLPSAASSAIITGRAAIQQQSTSPSPALSQGTTVVSRPRSLYEPSLSSSSASNKSKSGPSPNPAQIVSSTAANAPNHSLFNHSSRNSLDLQSLTSQMQALSTSTNSSSLSTTTTTTTTASTTNISVRQLQELNDKVIRLEQSLEKQRDTFQKHITDLAEKLQEEREQRIALQRELDKISQLVTQV